MIALDVGTDEIASGGLLKGNPTRPGGRYDPSTAFGAYQIKLYAQDQQQKAIEQLKAIGVRLILFHHSSLINHRRLARKSIP